MNAAAADEDDVMVIDSSVHLTLSGDQAGDDGDDDIQHQ